MNFLYAVLFFALMGGVYAFLYHMNHKTPVPAGCEDLKVECNGCLDHSCGNNPSHA